MAAGVRALWAAADEVYGRCGEFRDACRALSLAYVVIIPCDYRVTLAKDTVIRADQAIADAVFERRSCGNGTKGPRYSDWALIATAGPREFLLIRRLSSHEHGAFHAGAAGVVGLERTVFSAARAAAWAWARSRGSSESCRRVPVVHRRGPGRGRCRAAEKVAAIVSLPCWVHGVQDADVLPCGQLTVQLS